MEEPGIQEVNDNDSGKPRRECVGKGIDRLEMSLENNKKYAIIKSSHYSFGMTNEKHPLYRGNTSFMNVAANFLFAHVNEHAQMSAKAGIKKLVTEL